MIVMIYHLLDLIRLCINSCLITCYMLFTMQLVFAAISALVDLYVLLTTEIIGRYIYLHASGVVTVRTSVSETPAKACASVSLAVLYTHMVNYPGF